MSCSNVTCLSAKVWGQYNETNSKFADIIDDQGSSFLGPIRADKKNGYELTR
jgi:hypothetical protein